MYTTLKNLELKHLKNKRGESPVLDEVEVQIEFNNDAFDYEYGSIRGVANDKVYVSYIYVESAIYKGKEVKNQNFLYHIDHYLNECSNKYDYNYFKEYFYNPF